MTENTSRDSETRCIAAVEEVHTRILSGVDCSFVTRLGDCGEVVHLKGQGIESVRQTRDEIKQRILQLLAQEQLSGNAVPA